MTETNDKKAYKVALIISFIVIMVLCGYIGYDKIIDNDGKSNNSSKLDDNSHISDTRSKEVDDSVALALGYELYEYAKDALFCRNYQYGEMYSNDFGREVLNYKEIASKFSSNHKVKWTDSSDYKKLDDGFVNIEGKYYSKTECARGSNISFVSDELKITNIESDKIEFRVLATYCDDNIDQDWIYSSNKDCIKRTKTYDFIIVKEDNKWKIDTFTNPV